MSPSATKSSRHVPVKQFSIFTENKVGRLNEVVNLLRSHHIHVMALTTMDTTDSTIIRVVVDDPDAAADRLRESGFPFNESDLLVVELEGEEQLSGILCALLGAEINIHYIYPFIFRPKEKSALALNLEDIDLAASALGDRGFRVLTQGDISR
jgi:hypothetical protein